ncbi:hypothetical protein LC724_19915 [Blautia sp. RD014234]|nr:hypothetical protein [Blautia parvula]
MMTVLMGLSAAQAVADVTGRTAQIKWPNDLVMSGKNSAESSRKCPWREGKYPMWSSEWALTSQRRSSLRR